MQKFDRKAGWLGLHFVKALTPREWVAAKHFRDTYFFGPHGIDDPYTWTFNHEEHAHLVLYQGTEIIGYAHIQFWPDKRAAIRIIAVNENKRNQNAGSQFLALSEKWLKSIGVKSIHAESRKSSLGFYLKNGYCSMPFDDPEGHESDPMSTKKFEKGFVKGKGLEETGLTPEIVSWMDKAMNAYWRDRIYGILNQVGTGVSDKTIFKLWREVLDDMYGEDDSRKKEIYDIALADEKVSKKAKEWLGQFIEH